MDDNADYPKVEDFELKDNGTLTVTLDKKLPSNYDKMNMTLKFGNSKCNVKSIKD